MAFTTISKNAMLKSFASSAKFASLHSGPPDAPNTEIVGGNPTYARKIIVWKEPANSAINISEPITFDVPGNGTAVRFIGIYDKNGTAESKADPNSGPGNLLAYAAATEEVFGNQGLYILTDLELRIVDGS